MTQNAASGTRVHVYNLVGAAGIWDERRVEMLASISCTQERNTQYAFMRVNHSRLTTRKPTAETTIKKFLLCGILLTDATWLYCGH
jgi:hypothetical protein